MDRTHHYKMALNWTGNTGSGTSSYTAYSRNIDAAGPGKSTPLLITSDPVFRGDPTRYSPEELLVAAVSSCHMLWVLHLCADAKIVVTAYADSPDAAMAEHPDGSGELTEVILHPRLTLADPTRFSELGAIHEKAHSVCCLARSVNFPVHVVPQP